MFLEHNSQYSFYRAPHGAVKEGDTVRLRLYVASAHTPSGVFLLTERGERYKMERSFYMCGGGVYTISVKPQKTLFYGFLVEDGDTRIFYGNNKEALGGFGTVYDRMPETLFQITVYKRDFITPVSFCEGIVYQIFPDRFYKSGDVPRIGIARAWGEVPFFRAEQFGGEYTANDFFGGTLYGIIEKLPYLKSLGITHIYLNPIFDSGSNHGYNTRDYEKVASHLGGMHGFTALQKKAEACGIRLILDGVFSHTGDDSRYFKSAQHDENSPYRNWYTFGETTMEYDAWWGFPSLPNVRETEPSYLSYMLLDENAVVRQWLRRGIGGWRLDVADELPDAFLDAFRRVVKEENPDAVIIGEVWEDASNKVSYNKRRHYLDGTELDSVMNYPLRNAILDFVLGVIDAYMFSKRINSLVENYPKPALYAALNFLSTHDVPRLLTILGEAPNMDDREFQSTYRLPPEKMALAKKRLPIALLLQMTMPGVPCVYYGDEAGMEGGKDPFCRGTYPWGKEDTFVFSLYQEMLSLRKNTPDFIWGDIRFLYAEERGLSFCRGNTRISLNAGDTGLTLFPMGHPVLLAPMAWKIEPMPNPAYFIPEGEIQDENYHT